jgi:hypothetical protein
MAIALYRAAPCLQSLSVMLSADRDRLRLQSWCFHPTAKARGLSRTDYRKLEKSFRRTYHKLIENSDDNEFHRFGASIS